MSDPQPQPVDHSNPAVADALPRLVQRLVDHMAESRAAWERIEGRALPVLERIALALERGTWPQSGANGPALGELGAARSVGDEVRSAIDEGRWDRAGAILDGLALRGDSPEVEALRIELSRSRDRVVAGLNDRIEAARLANDPEGALAGRDELAKVLGGDDLKLADRSLVAWLMKLIQRRLRSVPVGSDLVALVSAVADRFGGTTEGASLRAALPTLRRSAGLCPRCAEPYLGGDDACPKCLAAAGQAPMPTPTLTFVSGDDLDAVVGDAAPVDLNNVDWQLP